MQDNVLPEPPDLDNIPEEDQAEAIELWNRKLLSLQVSWDNKTIGKLNKEDGINCDYCRNRGWISKIEVVSYGNRTHYASVTKPCRCRYGKYSKE